MEQSHRARVAPVGRPGLREDQRAVFDSIASGRRATDSAFPLTDALGRLHGPFGLMVLAPSVGHGLQSLGSAIRYSTELTAREREIAILLVAHHHDSEFERWAHTLVAKQVGLSNEEVAELVKGTAIGATTRESFCARLTTALLTRTDLDDAEFRRARSALGEQSMIELSVLVGYYSTLADMMRLFHIGQPDPQETLKSTSGIVV